MTTILGARRSRTIVTKVMDLSLALRTLAAGTPETAGGLDDRSGLCRAIPQSTNGLRP